MLDGVAVATLIILGALLMARRALAAFARRERRAQTHPLLTGHLAHWRYPPGAWRAYCDRERGEIWNRYLRPSARYLPPAVVLVGGLAWIAEQRSTFTNGAAALATIVVALVAANVMFGPSIRSFVRLSRRRDLDYEVYLSASGALEVWRQDEQIRASEEHAFTAGGGRIELVEAYGVEPGEIVFSLARPVGLGIQHTEARFLVPDGRLSEARALARALTPRPSQEHAP